MVFNSIAFAIFLPVVLLLYYFSPRERKNWVLLLAGYVFYGAWDVRFLFLVSVSTALDYCTGLMIGKGRMMLAQRLAASLYVLGFAFVFLVLNWSGLAFDQDPFQIANFRHLFDFNPFGVGVFLATLVAVSLAHCLYPFLAERLTEDRRRRFFLLCSLIGPGNTPSGALSPDFTIATIAPVILSTNALTSCSLLPEIDVSLAMMT